MIFQRLLIGFVALLPLHLSMMGNVSATVVTTWVTVGDPGNAEHTLIQADGTSGYGRVDYEYRIGKYEVTNAQYAEFLNAVAATDTYDLYWDVMQSDPHAGITRAGSSGNHTYSLKPNMGNKPVNYVTWHDAARYANWLHNGQPVGMQDASTTEDGAYTFTGLDTPALRNPGAEVFIPNEHEWQKAAFYEPGAVTNDGDEWWFYPTASDWKPQLAVATVNGDVRNPGPNVVNYHHGAGWNGQFGGTVTTVGSAGNSTYYGAEDMGGNVFEWTTADPNKPDPFNVGPYIVRGASFWNTAAHMSSVERNLGPPGHQHSFASRNNGFRVASYVPAAAAIPEPSTLVLAVMGILGVTGIRRKAHFFAVLLVAILFSVCTNRVTADTFGSGLNEIDIEFVTIGDPGNAPDTSGDPNPDLPGSVAYGYRIGKYEISEAMIAKVNAEGGLGIETQNRGPDKPATRISWIEAITFVNWLNTSSGDPAAYKFNGNNFALWQPEDAGYDVANPYRNTQAKYFLPSADEWYKAAFFDPTTDRYFDYATGSNETPERVASGKDPGTAVFGGQDDPADITLAGGLSPYGTMAQSGNIFELEETDFDLLNDAVYSPRGARGGCWIYPPGFLSKSFRNSINPDGESDVLGFRVASAAITADFDLDGDVDGEDFLMWQSGFGIQSGATRSDGDADGDGDVDGDDFLDWQLNFDGNSTPPIPHLVSVPEPSGIVLGLLGVVLAFFYGRRSE